MCEGREAAIRLAEELVKRGRHDLAAQIMLLVLCDSMLRAHRVREEVRARLYRSLRNYRGV